MKLKFSFLLSLVCIYANLFAQDSARIRLSVLTCSPGTELYSTFGHTAIRLIDSSSHIDIVFNYGTFNFDEPGFIFKFLKGSLPYYLSTENFTSFKTQYQWEERGMLEQVLNATVAQKAAIKAFLKNNIKEEHKYYQYDFSGENCTSRIRDIISLQIDSAHSLNTKPVMAEKSTYRQALHEYLNLEGNEWNKFGVDILIGAVGDKEMSVKESLYLPDNLMEALDSNQNLITSKNILLAAPYLQPSRHSKKPLFICCLLALILIALSFIKNSKLQSALTVIHSFYFFILAVLGSLALFMWLGSNYTLCKTNWNVLWMLPLHFLTSVFVFKQRANYFRFLFFWHILFLVTHFFIGQQFNIAIYPFVFLTLFVAYKKAYKNA